jgi:hypothetical protein
MTGYSVIIRMLYFTGNTQSIIVTNCVNVLKLAFPIFVVMGSSDDNNNAVLLGIPVKEIEVDETCPYTSKLGGFAVRIHLHIYKWLNESIRRGLINPIRCPTRNLFVQTAKTSYFL